MTSAFARFGLFLTALIAVNVLSAFLFFRLDLTADKRYTLSAATRDLLNNVDEPVHVNVYLTGDLPPGFERLEAAVRETLADFRAEAGAKVTYRFVDPTAETSTEAKEKLYQQLAERGLPPTNLFANEGGKRTEKLVFPGAIVSYRGKETPVLLLRGNKAASPEEQLNQSYEGVEYQLASAVRRLTQPEGSRRRVGLIAKTAVPPERFADLLANVQQNYDLFFVKLDQPGAITGVDALLVPKPDVPFTDDEAFKLDQYVVNGGRALFFVDGQRIDSIRNEGTFAQPLNLNLDELFFRWGARVNRDVVKDLNSAVIPLNVGNLGDKPNIQLLPWRFYPILNNFGPSAITRNLDALYGRFVSTLDTVRAPGIRKTVLVTTSPYTSVLKAPVLISYNEARQQPDPATYRGGTRLVGVLLEGQFRSAYAGRILPGDARANGFRERGQPGRVVICSDGDLVVNDVDYRRQAPLPLGYDRFTRQTFANREFALNALDYVVDPNGLITARQRQITLRPLDKIRLAGERTTWQLLNVVGPLVLIALVGVGWNVVRRRRYAT